MAKNQTAVSNEELVAALLTSGSITQAAGKCGISPRALYDRMAQTEFRAAYSCAKSDIIRQAVCSLNSRLTDAFGVIAGIMGDEAQPAAARLQAAKMIIDTAERFIDRAENFDRHLIDNRRFP